MSVVIAVASSVSSAVALVVALASMFRQRNKGTADYVGVALSGFNALVGDLRRQIDDERESVTRREHRLVNEIHALRMEVQLLRRELERHNIPLPYEPPGVAPYSPASGTYPTTEGD